MADFLDFLPLYVRTEDDIRTDMDADANAGLQPTDPDWVDVRPGSIFNMITQVWVLEAARLHDYISTIPAVAFIEFAYGEYLDYHATALNTERKSAVAATTNLVFTGTIGANVTTGTQVATEQVDINTPPVIFLTTQSAIIPGPLVIPASFAAAVALTGGHLTTPANRYYRVYANDAAGSTVPAAEVHATLTGSGNAGVVTLTWSSQPGATSYTVVMGTASGVYTNQVNVDGSVHTLVDDGTVVWSPFTALPTSNTTGGAVSIPAQASASSMGSAGNVGALALTQVVTFNQQVASVTNPLAVDNGYDVENDADLQIRLLQLQEGEGPGRVNDYITWATEWPGIERVKVLPLWQGPGTVGVVAMTSTGSPAASTAISGLQQDLDPYPGQGGGVAPIDHIVSVMPPAPVTQNVTATIGFAAGYSYDGANATTALRGQILATLNTYFDALDPGDPVVIDHIKAVLFGIEGIVTVTISVPSADVPMSLTTNPPQKAVIGTVTLN